MHSSEDIEQDDSSQLRHIPSALRDAFHTNGLHIEDDGLVRWKTDTRDHPRAWGLARKVYDTTIIVLIEGIMTLFSNVGTVSAEHAYEEFQISRVSAIAAFTTSYLVAEAIGGLFLAPFTETFGRRPSYIVSCLVYAIFNVIVAAPRSLAGVVVGRIGSGFVSAMGATVAVGSLEDMWDIRPRIWVVWAWVATAVGALGVGPVVSTFVSTSRLDWPWLYYIAAIVFAAMTVFSWGLQESRSSRRITNKMSLLLKKHDRSSGASSPRPDLRGDGDEGRPTFRTFITGYLARPISLLYSEPIVFFTTLMISVSYATIYLLPEGISQAYTPFGFTERRSSLPNLAFTIGAAISMLSRLIDYNIARRQLKSNVPLSPESKLVGFYIAAPLLAIATWWWAWTLPPHFSPSSISPFASMPALIFVGYAATEFDYVLSGYITDTYGAFASSATAPLGFVRASLSGVFPLFGRQMFVNLDNNIAGTVLAVIATAFVGIAVLFWKFGKRLREKSRFSQP